MTTTRCAIVIPPLCALLCSCATLHPRYTPQVIAVTAHTDHDRCTSQDEAFVAYRYKGKSIVVDAKTGAELWRDERELAYCGASGVVLAGKTFDERDSASNKPPEERRVRIRVVVRDYRSGRTQIDQVVKIRSCPMNRFYFHPWPRGEWVGLEWRGSMSWTGGAPPPPGFERQADRCDARGVLWVHEQSRAVETVRLEERPTDAASYREIQARRKARRLVVTIESKLVPGKVDVCDEPLSRLTLVAKWKGATRWTKPFGFTTSECRP